uniref:Uncharacterized protein n=1 Tax=Glossina pallidipes TaxID=7398 RepID=A0A1A9Z4Z3_GLOPL
MNYFISGQFATFFNSLIPFLHRIFLVLNGSLVGQAGVFLTAGFETSSSTRAFCYTITEELAKRNSLICEKINSLQHLNMILEETLLLCLILPFLDRRYKALNDEKHIIKLKPSLLEKSTMF